MMPMFDETSGWQEFNDECWRRACAMTGYTSEGQCRMIGQSRSAGGPTVGQALAAMFRTPEHRSVLVWYASHMLDALSADLRAALLDAATMDDPPSAAIIYRNSPHLTDAEDAMLRGRFYPFMPVARRQAEEGALKRVKANA